MTARSRSDTEIPETRREDWFGAERRLPGEDRTREAGEPITFFVFRASNDRGLFAVTATDDPMVLPPCPDNGDWVYVKRFRESGRARVGVDEAEAKSDIEKQGYHISRISIPSELSVGASD